MCGIAGEVNASTIVNRNTFANMCAQLAHRGPDGQGHVFLQNDRVALGHRRLAIVDLSNAGMQPMSNEDSSCWIVYNGEIYNFHSLRQTLEERGHTFKSRTDTEVILHAYEEWGLECVHRFRGMFAFGLWDERKRLLWLVRDRLGIKPLYYYWDGKRFIFASELKAIIYDGSISRELNMNSLSTYLAFGYVPLDRCIFQKFSKLAAGHYLTFSLSSEKIAVESYWDVTYSGTVRNESEAVDALKDKLDEAVRLRLISDVPLGLFLSGGVDSSGVAAFMQRSQSEPVRTFTIGFDVPAFDETPFARLVATHLKTSHEEQILTLNRARSLIPQFPYIYDEPFYDSSGLPTYLLSEFARQRVTVALAGDGGDEVFAGYRWYDDFMLNYGSSPTLDKLRAFAPAVAALTGGIRGRSFGLRPLVEWAEKATRDPVEVYFARMGFLTWEAQRFLLTQEVAAQVNEDPLWLFRRFFRRDWPTITALQYLDLKTYLADDILTKVDRASMAHGLEVRVPLLDHFVVEHAFRIHSTIIYNKGERKYVLKKALHNMLPQEILSPRKKGFSVPMMSWMENGLRNQARMMLMGGSLIDRGIVRSEALDQYLVSEDAGRIWLMLSLEMWIRRWLDNEDVTLPPLEKVKS